MSGSTKTDGATPPLESFLRDRRQWLLRRALGLCRTSSDAEDLVQETFMRFLAAFQPARALPDEAVCASWLISTMTNCFYDQLRRRRTQERGAQDPTLMPAGAVPAEAPAPLPFDRLTDEQMSSAIQRLTPRVRGTLELHVRGRKYREIAEELGIPPGTVAKRLHLARAKLRTLLEPLMQGGEH